MENKEKEKINFHNNYILLPLSIFLIFNFFYGFYANENSAGAGGYEGDFKLIWNNLQLFQQGIIGNFDNPLYTDSRPPLSYMLHTIFNPFVNEKEAFRLSTLFISSIVPLLFFFSIRQNYPSLNSNIAVVLSLIITLSPYFRTTAYWGLGENYGLIFLILSHLLLSKFLSNHKTYNKFQNILSIFTICVLGSLVVYFDQKLVFIPLLVFIIIQFAKVKPYVKIFTVFLFVIFSLPYLYLMHLWGSIIPTSASNIRGVGSSINLYNIGFCLSIIVFYLIPFFRCKKINFIKLEKIKFSGNFLFVTISIVTYTILLLLFTDYKSLDIEGKGVFFKLSLILFENIAIRITLTLFLFFISAFFIFYFFDNKNDFLIILFFLILSLLTIPFYQEYLDPLIYILIFTFFKTRLKFSYKNIYFIVFYFFIFLQGSELYYKLIL